MQTMGRFGGKISNCERLVARRVDWRLCDPPPKASCAAQVAQRDEESSETAKSLFVRLIGPFAKGRERIVRRVRRRLVEQDATFRHPIAERIPRFQAKALAHLARDDGLAFDRNLGERGLWARLALHRVATACPQTLMAQHGYAGQARV